MKERTHEWIENGCSTGKKASITTIIALAWCLWLSSCDAIIDHQAGRVAKLRRTLEKQWQNYDIIAGQQNIQQDLKQEWADPTINQEIWYALDWADNQDGKIARTKRRLRRAQKNLMWMQEHRWNKKWSTIMWDDAVEEQRLNSRLPRWKYDYIDEEYRRSAIEQQNNCD